MKKSILTTGLAFALVFAHAQIKVYSSGKVFVGGTATTPLSKLDVSGGVAIGSYAGANAAPTNGLIVSGNVGIGTASPTAVLEVSTGNILINKTSAYNQIGVTRSSNSYGASLNLNTSSTNDWIIGTRGVSNSDFRLYSYGTTSDVFVVQKTTGNVGLGTTSPIYQLELSANSAGKPSSSTWIVSSDKRVKKDIAGFSDGLKVLREINPVIYKYNGLAHTPAGEEGIGIIAQDMQKIAPYTVKSMTRTLDSSEVAAFPGDISTATVAIDSAHTKQVTQGTILGFDAHPLFFILINSVKELDSVVTSLKNQLNTSGQRINNNSGQGRTETTSQIDLANNNAIILYQNEPNPFEGNTVIRYYIPENMTGPAYISFADMYGKEIKRLEITAKGFGKVEANTENLASGIYSYSISVNGMILDTKKMIRNN